MTRSLVFRALIVAVLLPGCAADLPRGGTAGASAAGPIAQMPNRAAPVIDITRIVDGDTVTLYARRTGRSENARLTGFDAPETHRPGCAAEARAGTRATRHLEALLADSKEVHPRLQGRDKYGRVLVALTLDGRSLASLMIAAGVAVPYDGGKRIDWCQRLT